MENNTTKTEPAKVHKSLSKKIGNVLWETHYKLGADSIYILLINIYY